MGWLVGLAWRAAVVVVGERKHKTYHHEGAETHAGKVVEVSVEDLNVRRLALDVGVCALEHDVVGALAEQHDLCGCVRVWACVQGEEGVGGNEATQFNQREQPVDSSTDND